MQTYLKPIREISTFLQKHKQGGDSPYFKVKVSTTPLTSHEVETQSSPSQGACTGEGQEEATVGAKVKISAFN